VKRFATALLCALALASPAATQPAPSEQARPHLDAAPPSPSLEARLLEIRERVQAAASYPESARMRGASGETRVAFEIETDGRPVGIEVVRSSGSVALDRAAEQAVRDAGALPRVIGRVNVPVRFALVGQR
jgi:protein TonB